MKFIKLSSVVLNTRFIHKILIKPESYEIHMESLEKMGTIFVGSGGFTFKPDIWKISKGSDYDIVTHWINKQ
jgi:hypothetical protein